MKPGFELFLFDKVLSRDLLKPDGAEQGFAVTTIEASLSKKSHQYCFQYRIKTLKSLAREK